MTEKRTIDQHIQSDKQILDNPMISSQKRRHTQEELERLEKYKSNHPEDLHDPTDFEMFCDEQPWAVECKLYED